mmetsp:Transcript_2674/g.7373  ORF Transcript_2674/g.7373 Transcript_2674/m.7373 type:complete len:130 (+) Transcript_2674:146-535(+)
MPSIVQFFTISAAILSVAAGFQIPQSGRPSTAIFQGDGTGGWGIGPARQLTPQEFAKGERSHFEGFEIQKNENFMQQLKDDTETYQDNDLAELLGVAKIAGLKVRSPSERRLGKFDLADDDKLDVSVED